jgi:hypothetical protein
VKFARDRYPDHYPSRHAQVEQHAVRSRHHGTRVGGLPQLAESPEKTPKK